MNIPVWKQFLLEKFLWYSGDHCHPGKMMLGSHSCPEVGCWHGDFFLCCFSEGCVQLLKGGFSARLCHGPWKGLKFIAKCRLFDLPFFNHLCALSSQRRQDTFKMSFLLCISLLWCVLQSHGQKNSCEPSKKGSGRRTERADSPKLESGSC